MAHPSGNGCEEIRKLLNPRELQQGFWHECSTMVFKPTQKTMLTLPLQRSGSGISLLLDWWRVESEELVKTLLCCFDQVLDRRVVILLLECSELKEEVPQGSVL